MRKTIKTRLSVGGAGIAAISVIALSLGLVAPANADYAPSSTDVVGVGSDTVQNIADFLGDGDVAGDTGYNAANNVNKFVSFDATPDANDRSGYLNGSTNAALKPLNPTVVLRAGTNPVQRPNGSGAGIAALLADTGVVHQIDFVRASRLPKASEQATAAANGWGYLHVVQIATDPLQVAVANTTNAPAGLSAAELVSIYSGAVTKWNQLPGNSGGSSDTIIPLLPQNGSGTRSSFLADLQTANGGTAVTLAASVVTVEENDPASITTQSNPADAIAPFSGGRLALYNSGYFHNPATVFPGGAAVSPGIKLVTGTTTEATPGPSYLDTRGLYILFRQSDASLAPWQPGGTKNWSQVLFSGTGTPFVKGGAGQALIDAGGVLASYADLGNTSAG